MSAYSNFGKGLNDQSALGWAQGAAMIGQAIAGVGKNIAGVIKEAQAKQEKKQEKFDLTWAEVSLNENRDLSEDRQKMIDAGTSAEIADMFLEEQKTLMNGVGKAGDEDYVMGSIEAQTLIRTTTGLDPKLKTQYQDLILKADTNIQDILKRGGVLMTEAEEIDALKGSVGPGKDKSWRGDSFSEQTASSFTSFRLNNQTVPGVTTTEKLNKENGNLVFTHVVSKKSPLLGNLNLEEFNKWDKQNMKDDGKGNWVITQALGKDFEGDLLRDVKKAVNYTELGKSPEVAIINPKTGILDPQYMTRLPSRTTTFKQDGLDQMYDTSVDFINKNMMDDKFSNAMAGKIEGIYGLDPQAKIDYLRNRRGVSLPMSFAKLPPDEQRQKITEIENNALVNELGEGGWIKRKLTTEEAKMLSGKNGNPVPADEEAYKQWFNSEHYFKETKGDNLTEQEKTIKTSRLKDIENKRYFTDPRFVNKPKKDDIIEGFRGNTSLATQRIKYREGQPAKNIERVVNNPKTKKMETIIINVKAKPAGWYLEKVGTVSSNTPTGSGSVSQSMKEFVDAGLPARSLNDWSQELGYGVIN